MAKQPNLSKYQRGIVNRYYEHQDTIYLSKLGDLVGEIALLGPRPIDASQDPKEAKRAKLWKSARDYLAKCEVNPAIIAKVCDAQDVAGLSGEVAKLSRGGAK